MRRFKIPFAFRYPTWHKETPPEKPKKNQDSRSSQPSREVLDVDFQDERNLGT